MNFDFIKTPYTTKPFMVKNNSYVFNPLPNLNYIKSKKQELDVYNKELWAVTDECEKNQLVRKTCNHLNLIETDNIVDLALQIEEDIAIMHKGVLAGICFCFPSSFYPASRVGMRLMDIHAAVADSQALVAVSDRLAETMADTKQGSFLRHVWTINSSSDLSNYPSKMKSLDIKGIEDLYFRIETQTTEPLGDGVSSLLFVKIDVIPLIEIWPEQKGKILDSINSMTDSIIDYKNLRSVKELINKFA